MGKYDRKPKLDAKIKLRMDVFSEDELKKIHESTLDVFENIGILVDSAEAKNIYVGAGATAEDRPDGKFLVKIPRNVVNQAIADAPKWFKVYGLSLIHICSVSESGRSESDRKTDYRNCGTQCERTGRRRFF